MTFRKAFACLCVPALAVALFASAVSAAPKGGEKKFAFSTKSKEAVDYVNQVYRAIDSFQFGTQLNETAKKAVAADPGFAIAHYFVGVTSNSQEEAQPHLAKAFELGKTASDPERRFLEAVQLNISQKQAEAIPILEALAKEYPEMRMFHMVLGQYYMGQGKRPQAKAEFEHALKLDASTPRVHSLLGNIALAEGDFTKARELYKVSLSKKVNGTAPFGPMFGFLQAYIYEGKHDEAIKVAKEYLPEYEKSGGSQNFPPVFIYNLIGRLYLESGRPAEAMPFYVQGFKSVETSNLPADQKTIWNGRLYHGHGRCLAKLGKYDEAWQKAETIKKMIEEGGEQGKQFWTSYHYLAGYIKLESGDYKAAVEHLKQSNLTDEFHELLLARAYDKVGDSENAQKLYKAIVGSTQMNLDRALSYNEAKKKLKKA